MKHHQIHFDGFQPKDYQKAALERARNKFSDQQRKAKAARRLAE